MTILEITNKIKKEKIPKSELLKYNNNFSLMIEALKREQINFPEIDLSLKTNREFVLESVKINGLNLSHSFPIFQLDKEIVYEATKNNSVALNYAHSSLKNDVEFILKNMENSVSCLEFASDNVKQNLEVGLYAVKNYDYGLLFISPELRKNKTIVKAAVGKYPISFFCSSEELRNDKDFILELIKEINPFPFHQLSNELKTDKNIIIACLHQNLNCFQHIPLEHINNTKWLLELALELEDNDLLSAKKENRNFFFKCFSNNDLKFIFKNNYPNSSFEKEFLNNNLFLKELFTFLHELFLKKDLHQITTKHKLIKF